MNEHEPTTRQPAPEVLDPVAREERGYDRVPSAPPAPVYDKLKPAPAPTTPPPTAPPPTDKK